MTRLDIPAVLRAQVDERDRFTCRFCGRKLGARRVIHHIRYGGDRIGTGGRRYHHIDNLITLCGDFDGRCHRKVHDNKRVWQPVLIALIEGDVQHMTALAYRRLQERNEKA